MELTLGPWRAEKTVDSKQGAPLVEAMGEEAWSIVKRSPDFTPVKAQGKPAGKGYTISGRLTSVAKAGANTQVVAKFSIWLDGVFTNVPETEGRAAASRGSTAEDALRAATENRIKALLGTIKSGRVAKVR
jgi:hypothetical protein